MPDNHEFTKLLVTPAPADLGPGPRPGVRTEAELNLELEGLLARANVEPERAKLIRALVLLWHDHLDASHTLSQSVDNSDGAFVHGIMHRREPDYGNAAYWFRRVGAHGAFSELAKRAGGLLDSQSGAELRQSIIRDGTWNPFAFIDECERANRHSGSPDRSDLLRKVQQIESETLLDWLCKAI